MSSGGWDLAVIGGGVAGVMAALEGAAAGARVVLVRAGPGATALSGGGWRGPLPTLLRAPLEAAGLPYVPVDSPLPHPDGELRDVAFAGASHARAALAADTTVVGIAGLPGFRPAPLARLWGAGAHALLELDGTPAAGWSPVSLAARLDADPALLARPLAALGTARHVVLPAVLGLDRHADVLTQLAPLSLEIGEALGAAPSVPGWRLDRALLHALAAAAVTVRQGRVVDRRTQGDRLEAVTLAGDVASGELTADRFVLATGRFVGGGITASDVTDAVDVAHGRALREARLVERALGCDVWVDHLGERFTQVQPVPLTVPVRREAQPLLSAGVHTDAEGRPLDDSGRARYTNVVARGAVVAGRPHGLGFAAGADA